jgi:hypothetical protein
VLRDFEIALEPRPGALLVSERLVIENPSHATYVGRAATPDTEPTTLSLRIPADFEKVVFQDEFYGRRFSMRDGVLATGIPWTPGRRELRYTYLIRNDGARPRWGRPLDLPCDRVRLVVKTATPRDLAVNLPPVDGPRPAESVFESNAASLPAGFEIQVELARAPVPFMAHARWLVLAALGVAIAACVVVFARRRSTKGQVGHKASDAASDTVSGAGSTGHHRGSKARDRRRARRAGIPAPSQVGCHDAAHRSRRRDSESLIRALDT